MKVHDTAELVLGDLRVLHRRHLTQAVGGDTKSVGDVLELDHVFALVADSDDAVARLQADGWILDAGQAHPGQGTGNRRLRWRGVFFELAWITDENEATTNVLRLGRRTTTAGASPFGIAVRGWSEPTLLSDYRLYDALGPRIWIHRDNESAPERPMLLVFETDQQMGARRRLLGADTTITQPVGELHEIRLHGTTRLVCRVCRAAHRPSDRATQDGAGGQRRRIPVARHLRAHHPPDAGATVDQRMVHPAIRRTQ